MVVMNLSTTAFRLASAAVCARDGVELTGLPAHRCWSNSRATWHAHGVTQMC
jgi:hypothetical protein